MNQKWKDRIEKVAEWTAYGIVIAGAVTWTYFGQRAQQMKSLHKLLNEGITHQYIDTNQDGRYDFYRFLQRKNEQHSIYVDGCLASTDNLVQNRIDSAPMYGEHTREECSRAYRIGDIEFLTLEDSGLSKGTIEKK